MNEPELSDVWTILEPTAVQRERIDARVFSWLEARDTPLAAEWLGLFRIAPITTVALVTSSAVSLAFATPFLWLARALL